MLPKAFQAVNVGPATAYKKLQAATPHFTGTNTLSTLHHGNLMTQCIAFISKTRRIISFDCKLHKSSYNFEIMRKQRRD